MKVFTRTIWILSLVSLMTDISSEMLYPVMPMFLTSVGFSVLWIGVLEGIAEATAGFSKGYFGKISDSMGKRVPFVRLGYFLSSLAKPAMVLIAHPIWVLFVRTSDRLGKGIRSSARDAILSSESTPENKGKVFGVHRAADTFGAAIGPLFALLFLHFYPEKYVWLFIIAFIPAIIGVSFTLMLKESSAFSKSEYTRPGFFSFLKYWKTAGREYKMLVTGLIAFAVINSSDIFLILLAKNRGLSDQTVIAAYIFYNLVYAVFSTPMGWLGDKVSLKSSYLIGLSFFAIVYLGVSFAETELHFFAFFFLYGIYAAGTEGISKAWISNISHSHETATAIGFYNSFQSVGALIASITAGVLWNIFSPSAPFIFSGVVTVLIIFYLMTIKTKKLSA